MSVFVDIVMFGWIPVVLLLCAMLPSRRAVVASFIIAWSFLPITSYHIEGIPEYSKMSATCGGVLLAALFFDTKKLFAFRPSWIDLPMALWCMAPFFSSISNGLGWYDGISGAFAQTVAWGFPYFIGRLHLGDLAGLKELAIGIFYGGLAYVPLCLYEIRMSPQLNNMLYGFYTHDFAQTMRFGGWRPTVFMLHGLMVGMWMCMASLIGIWLWWTGTLRRVWVIPMWILVPTLTITAILCKSTGACALLAAGLLALAAIKLMGTRVMVWLLILTAPAYMVLRATQIWDGSEIQEAAEWISQERSQSVDFRFQNENVLIDKALQQPLLGWGGWERNQVVNTKTGFRTIVDGRWIDAMGKYGILGIAAFTAYLLLPAWLLLKRINVQAWNTPTFAPVAALLVVCVLYMIDNLPNAMDNPVYALAAGGLAGVLAYRPQEVRPALAVPIPIRRRPAAVAVQPRIFAA